jgi:hypothetical protein
MLAAPLKVLADHVRLASFLAAEVRERRCGHRGSLARLRLRFHKVNGQLVPD